MSYRSADNCAVQINGNTLVGIGTWDMSGIQSATYDTTAFGDTYKQFISGIIDSGTISFSGVFDPDDTTGQILMGTYQQNQTHVTDIKLYIDSSSYYIPSTTNPSSYVLITQHTVNASMGNAIKTTFQGKVSGKMVLV